MIYHPDSLILGDTLYFMIPA